ncbi:phage head closure protein [Sphingomonas nostoxanthinifaciens]|uniref:phage head closure protein n=1 Tax=Sphingomonas nostoxanthinifaciens TaxID=2872652 RepID=UPI001CC21ACA|nr:phage head closure protein [Sphingomonas nostoxanthinifaciens]UAK23666.1 phage head closure protein [Sphingomonas nostoxanthinifaciens]
MATLPALRAGDLRHQIEFMQPVQLPDRAGGSTKTWQATMKPWAEVLGQDGREAVIAQALQGISTYRIRIRWRTGIDPSWQIRLNGTGGIDLNILSITDPNGDREQLLIIADTAAVERTT